jgi:two-component system cell cycle response regulator
MIRVLLVDDSAAVRELLTARLKERGYDVTSASDPLLAAELATEDPPDFVVTDLWMPGISGVQLCRLLRSEPRTAHVPVILITAESQRKSRFWAKSAGAAAYVAKDAPEALFDTLAKLAAEPRVARPAPLPPPQKTPVHHRLFQRLDADLFASVVAGEVRSLAQEEGEAESMFRGLTSLLSEVTAYRWLAVRTEVPARLFVHTEPRQRVTAEAEARMALGAPPEMDATVICDERAVAGTPCLPVVAPVQAGARAMGSVALGPSSRGASRDDRELVGVVAAELSGPLRVVSVVEQSKRLAMSDPLTGLLNRRAFSEMMVRSLASFERYGEPVSVLLLDVDHFKRINDTHGHEAGDAVLVSLAETLRGFARRTDCVARWGGEEFVVGLSHTRIPAVAIPAERIRKAILERPIRLPNGRFVSVTVSVGVAAAVAGEGLDALVARADRALYVAKDAGRNRCEYDDGRTSSGVHPTIGASVNVEPLRVVVR